MSQEEIAPLSLDVVRASMPKNFRCVVTQEVVDKLNEVSKDERVRDIVRDNFVAYSDVLQNNHYGVDQYIKAVTYVSHKLMGKTNQDAYAMTFPDRMAKLVAEGRSEKEIAGYVSMYNRGKLVNQILEQSMVPTWVLNQDIYQKAINTQARLMATAESERVQCMAAESILNHLKKPEQINQPLVNIDLRDTSGIEELKATMATMAQRQLELIKQGEDTRTIAEQKIVFNQGDDVEDVTAN